MIGTVVDVEFTRGSPFGEQWWTFDVEGKNLRFAMWLNFNLPNRWPRRGDIVEIEETEPRRCYTGGGGYIELSHCANLTTILTRKEAVA